MVVFLSLAGAGAAYSVLTHEQIVDNAWQARLEPMLRKRYPRSTPEELRQAHAYAYGGCLIQDMGYYRFGNRTFSDLTHYVRTGDFVAALIEEASNVNEYAFALGALAHYASDNTGHPTVNRVVALQFPKLRAKYGDEVRYADHRKSHIRSEFGFDVVQVAKNRYTSDQYRDLVGFEVAQPVMERAFLKTYGLELKDVFTDIEMAVGTYRWAITELIPEMTRVVLASKHDEIADAIPTVDQKNLAFRMSRAEFEQKWGRRYKRPGFLARTLAFVLKIVPKVGPFSALKIEVPTPQVEEMYLRSVKDTVETYDRLLLQASRNDLRFPNRDFDTGKPTRAGEYPLADSSYAELLEELAENNFDGVPPHLQRDILRFYANRNAPIDAQKKDKAWRRTLVHLERLRAYQPAPTATAETAER